MAIKAATIKTRTTTVQPIQPLLFGGVPGGASMGSLYPPNTTLRDRHTAAFSLQPSETYHLPFRLPPARRPGRGRQRGWRPTGGSARGGEGRGRVIAGFKSR